VQAPHPDAWECHFLRGMCCARCGAAQESVAAFGAAIAVR
jgi:hypothetical protein